MISTSNVSFSYDSGLEFNFPDLHCKSSETCLILGKSGVGKTTLLHLLAGLIKPNKGEVIIDNQTTSSLPNNQIDAFRGQNIGIVFQKPHFISSINILSNLLLTQKLGKRTQSKSEILEILDALDIKNRAYAKPSELSQGELQRASVARAILNKPKVILADEPTSALDDESCDQVLKLLQGAALDLGAALLIVTHDGRLKDVIPNQISLS